MPALRAVRVTLATTLLCTLAACGGRSISIPPGDGEDAGLPQPDSGLEDSGRVLHDARTPLPDTAVVIDADFDASDTSAIETDSAVSPGSCDYTTTNASLCEWTTVYPANPVSCVNTNLSSQQICAALCGASSDGTPADRCYVGTGDMVDCYVDTDPACGGGGPGDPSPPPGNG